MKIKLCKIFLVAALAAALASQSVYASGFLTMYGTCDVPSAAITVLALRKDVEAEKITREDIVYLNQFMTRKDGSFAITLPWPSYETYTVRSNMDFNMHDPQQGKKTVYVSPAHGNDSNSGMDRDSAFRTLDAAYRQIFCIAEIVLLDDAEYTEAPEHEGELVIKGAQSTVMLTIPAEVSLKGDMTFDNLVLNGPEESDEEIYANGFRFKITQTVTSASTGKYDRPFVYGGKKSAPLYGDTYITLLGGKFWNVYGGGSGGAVYGDTHVVFGGNANQGDGIDDSDSTTLSPTTVFGGGKGAPVYGTTNVTLQDNAAAYYLVGAGFLEKGTATGTNIVIEGGRAMNVYAGSKNTPLSECDTHVTMTGGLVEAIFGGCESVSMTGSAYITLKGGEVTRRIFSGCYNSFSTDNSITGCTTLAIYPEAKLITRNGLQGDNDSDCGVRAGSRFMGKLENEKNTVLFLNGSYQNIRTKVMRCGEDYVAAATVHGEVRGTSSGGMVELLPDTGYVGTVDGNVYEHYVFNSTNGLDAPVNIEFVPGQYAMNDLAASLDGGAVTGKIDVTLNNTGAESPLLYIALYEKLSDGNEMLLGIDVQSPASGNNSFTVPCQLEKNKKYTVRAMLWNGNTLKPLTTFYSIELK